MDENKITKDMQIGKVVEEYPQTGDVFVEHGLHCIGCAVAPQETLEEAAIGHNVDLDSLLADLNKKINEDNQEQAA